MNAARAQTIEESWSTVVAVNLRRSLDVEEKHKLTQNQKRASQLTSKKYIRGGAEQSPALQSLFPIESVQICSSNCRFDSGQILKLAHFQIPQQFPSDSSLERHSSALSRNLQTWQTIVLAFHGTIRESKYDVASILISYFHCAKDSGGSV